jgi:hypothetical protein
MRRRLLFALVTVVVLPAALLLLTEGAARLYFHLRYARPGKTYGLWRHDDVLGAQHREHSYNSIGVTNDHGFRNDEDVLQPKPPGALRLIVYGGSTTYCYNLLTADTWPYRLERRLRAGRPGGEHDQVLNAGAVMWSLGHAFARAKKDVPRLEPDVVILYSGINEWNNAHSLAGDGISLEQLVAQGRFGVFATNLAQTRWWSRNLVVAKIIETYAIQPLQRSRDPAPEDWSPEPLPYVLENYLQVLARFGELLREHGALPVFVVQIRGDDTLKNRHVTSYSRVGAARARELGFVVVDPTPVVDQYPGDRRELFADTGVHLSAQGAARLGDYLFEQLAPVLEQRFGPPTSSSGRPSSHP